jgi:hypothetical protein
MSILNQMKFIVLQKNDNFWNNLFSFFFDKTKYIHIYLYNEIKIQRTSFAMIFQMNNTVLFFKMLIVFDLFTNRIHRN